jgi:hypothetical protein
MIVMAALPICANFGVQFESTAIPLVVPRSSGNMPIQRLIVDGRFHFDPAEER